MLGRDGIAGLVCLALSLFGLALTRGLPAPSMLPVGPGFYPRIVLTLMAGLSAILVVSDVIAGRRGTRAVVARPAVQPNYRLVAATFAIFAAYVALLPPLGFRIATFLFVAVLQVVLEPPRGSRRWALVLAVALATTWLTYLAFERYLSVLLPRGTWTGM
ncbi:MAG: tripartite tricarboxylate transporter TctB family protein [Betaproteobacteria bacterium]|nr:tripartite tricarboxylate transporter TctB family protein [Betaproteobacteria bacterium]